MKEPSAAFVPRLWRLYRYYRGRYVPPKKAWARVYVIRPKSPLVALRFAWSYAKKGADAV